MHAAPNSCRYSRLTTVMIALRQKVDGSRAENSWEVSFVAVAVYLWTDKRYVACLLTKAACSFSYMRTCLKCLLTGKVRLLSDGVSDTCSTCRLIMHLLASI